MPKQPEFEWIEAPPKDYMRKVDAGKSPTLYDYLMREGYIEESDVRRGGVNARAGSRKVTSRGGGSFGGGGAAKKKAATITRTGGGMPRAKVARGGTAKWPAMGRAPTPKRGKKKADWLGF